MNYIFILLSLIIINIPSALNIPGNESIAGLLNIAVILGVIFMTCLNIVRFSVKDVKLKMESRDDGGTYNRKIKLFSFCYVLILLMSIIRLSFNGTLDIINIKIWAFIVQLIFIINTYLIFADSKYNKDYIKLNICFICSIPIYITTNVVLALLGLRKQPEMFQSVYGSNSEYGIGSSFILSLLDIDAKRIFFLLTDGINSFGVTAGASIITSLIIFRLIVINNRNNRNRRKLLLINAVFLLLEIFAIVISDNRASLLAVLLVIIFMLIKNNKVLKILLSTIVPITLLVMFLSQARYNLDFLSRSDSSNIFSDRDIVWGFAIARLVNFSPIDLIGFGMYGQVTSGLSNNYSFLFSNRNISNTATLHNFFLQTIFDIGYIGLFVISAIIFTVIKEKNTHYNHLKNKYNNSDIMEQNIMVINQAKILLLIYFLLVGMTEALPSFYYVTVSLIFHTILVSELFSTESIPEKSILLISSAREDL